MGEDFRSQRQLERLFPGGRLTQTAHGACFILDQVYPAGHEHGRQRLGEVGALPAAPAAALDGDGRYERLAVRDFVYLDTETTGLMGAGTLAFMVGVAYFEGDAFVARQYFLRDHGDEPAMLHLLAELLAGRAGLITFNGRCFDLPLLDNRYLLNRLDGLAADWLARPHLDLLPPARRLWRSRVGSCSLASLERNVLGLRRSGQDVPGWLIPSLYFDYLRSGDARPLAGVFYHNRLDLLSMVALTGQILGLLARPEAWDQPRDLVSLARWQLALGLAAAAEENLRLAAAQELPLAQYQQALRLLAGLLKRAGRRDEAVSLWQQLAVTSFDDVSAFVELAKDFEWRQRDPAAARDWTLQAIALLQRRRAANPFVLGELRHRLARLEHKLAPAGQRQA
ncbi:MAG: ribonuclease H-like domain-containing protein [Candidatus Promineifilaceae bacterium]